MREVTVTLLSFAITAAFAIASGVLGAVLYEHAQKPPPRVQIIDLQKPVAAIASDPALAEATRRARVAEIGERMSHLAEERAAEGVIVLDASAVLRAPADAYVAP
jgi:hypothetical protein